MELQIANGVEGVIVGGTTGEGQLMSWDEHIMLIAHTVNCFGGAIRVVGNTGSNSTREAVHATEQGFAVGMDAALQINPYYGKTSRAGLLTHFLAALGEGPGIVYNVPGRTGQDIPDDVILALADHPNMLGVKECTGNPRIEGYTSRGVACWSGNDDEAHAARHSHGATGVISVASNLLPGAFSHLMEARDDALAAKLEKLIAWLFIEPNPIGVYVDLGIYNLLSTIPLLIAHTFQVFLSPSTNILIDACSNTALMMCGLVKPVFRLPYVPLSREQREEGALLLEDLKEYLPGVDEIRVMDDDEFTVLSRF